MVKPRLPCALMPVHYRSQDTCVLWLDREKKGCLALMHWFTLTFSSISETSVSSFFSSLKQSPFLSHYIKYTLITLGKKWYLILTVCLPENPEHNSLNISHLFSKSGIWVEAKTTQGSFWGWRQRLNKSLAPIFRNMWLPKPYLVHVSNQLLPTPTVELAEGTLAESK